MSVSRRVLQKPKALAAGTRLGVFAPSSPADHLDKVAGIAELTGHGFQITSNCTVEPCGYFAGSHAERVNGFLSAINSDQTDGVIALRGGYGSNYLLDFDLEKNLSAAKCVIGFSDITSLQVYLWERCGWVTIHGPMIAAGLSAGAGARKGYDETSFLNAISRTDSGWTIPLRGEALSAGIRDGRLLGGCLTMLQNTIGTPWELQTRDAILLLEDRAMKPWQVDRALMHLTQAGKFTGVKGIVLGEFPEGEPAAKGSPTVRDVCLRILGPLNVPIVFGAPVGHTPRPMLTVPLGVMARLTARGEGSLEILEPAVVE